MRLYCWLCIGMLLLTACGGAEIEQDTEPFLVPISAFIAALEAQDIERMLSLIEPTDWRDGMGAELRSSLASIETLTFDNLIYETLDASATSARVRVTATVTYQVGGESDIEGEHDIDTVVESIKVDNTWYVRGLDLTNLVAPPTEDNEEGTP